MGLFILIRLCFQKENLVLFIPKKFGILSGSISIGRMGGLEPSGCRFESCLPDNKSCLTFVKTSIHEKPVQSEVEGSPVSPTTRVFLNPAKIAE